VIERPFVFSPADGQAITLDDLAAFVAEAYSAGVTGPTPIRCTGSLAGFDMANGPRMARLTVLPKEVARVDA
jgi:hypothetical protein